MYYVGKVLQQAIFPFNIGMVLLVVSLLLQWRGKRRLGMAATGLALVVLVVPALPIVSDSLLAGLERTYPARSPEAAPLADAIVVLGGSTAPTEPPRLDPEEIYGSRLLPAARLYHADKAPIVVVSGGARYVDGQGRERSQAEDMRDILLVMGVPASAILLEGESRNTQENAERTRALLMGQGIPAKRLLLVTSAFHQWRAKQAFEQMGFEVDPFPTGHRVTGTRWRIEHFLPGAGALDASSLAIKEYIGRLAQEWPRPSSPVDSSKGKENGGEGL